MSSQWQKVLGKRSRGQNVLHSVQVSKPSEELVQFFEASRVKRSGKLDDLPPPFSLHLNIYFYIDLSMAVETKGKPIEYEKAWDQFSLFKVFLLIIQSIVSLSRRISPSLTPSAGGSISGLAMIEVTTEVSKILLRFTILSDCVRHSSR